MEVAPNLALRRRHLLLGNEAECERVSGGKIFAGVELLSETKNAEVVGICGISGSGKSVLSGIFEPVAAADQNPESTREPRAKQVFEADLALYLGQIDFLNLDQKPSLSPSQAKGNIKKTRCLETFRKNFICPRAFWMILSAIKMAQKKGQTGELILPMWFYNREKNDFDHPLRVQVPPPGKPLVVEGTLVSTLLDAEIFDQQKAETENFLRGLQGGKFFDESIWRQMQQSFGAENSLTPKVAKVLVRPPIGQNIVQLFYRDYKKGKFFDEKGNFDREIAKNRFWFRVSELLQFELIYQSFFRKISDADPSFFLLKMSPEYAEQMRQPPELYSEFLSIWSQIANEELKKEKIKAIIREVFESPKNTAIIDQNPRNVLQQVYKILRRVQQSAVPESIS